MKESVWYTGLLALVGGAFLTACQPNQQSLEQSERQTVPPADTWTEQAVWRSDSSTLAHLRDAQTQQLYLKLYQVSWDSLSQSPHFSPTTYLADSLPPQLDIVPVVRVQLPPHSVLQPAQEQLLADSIDQHTQHALRQRGIHSRQLVVASSGCERADYAAVLRHLQQLTVVVDDSTHNHPTRTRRYQPLGATVHVWQLEAKRVPPADYVVVLPYCESVTPDCSQPHHPQPFSPTNWITSVARYAASYPLPKVIMLSRYTPVQVCRRGVVVDTIEHLLPRELQRNTHFFRRNGAAANNSYHVLQHCYVRGVDLYPSDELFFCPPAPQNLPEQLRYLQKYANPQTTLVVNGLEDYLFF